MAVRVLDLCFVIIAVWLGSKPWLTATASPGFWPQATILCVAWAVVSFRYKLYQSRRTMTLLREFVELVEAWVMALAIGSLAILCIWGDLGFGLPITACVAPAAIFGLRVVVRQVLRLIRSKGWNYRTVVLVGRGEASHTMAKLVASRAYYGIQIMGSFHLEGETGPPPDGVECRGDAAHFSEVIAGRQVDSVLFCPELQVSWEVTQNVLSKCDTAGIECLFAPDFLNLNNLTASPSSFGGVPAITLNTTLGSPIQLAVKRAMDIAGATVGLLVASPVLIAVAIAIKLTDRGPLFFRQVRAGKDGLRFDCYKFRSMRVNAEAEQDQLHELNEADGPVFKIKRDPRITAMGHFIRKYSLDELPQLINVLKGDMSLVGPRPPVPAEVAKYSWVQRRRISVRPGLTCVWQVRGRNSVPFEKWIEMDLFYIDNWSLWLDIKLMLQTMPALVRGTGM